MTLPLRAPMPAPDDDFRDPIAVPPDAPAPYGLAPESGRRVELTGMRRDGSEFPIELTVAQTSSDPVRSTGFVRDNTQHKQLERRLRYEADHDDLTSLFNRRRFEVELAAHVRRSLRAGEHFALIVMNLDHLKMINDTFGPRAGDALLHRGRGGPRRATRRKWGGGAPWRRRVRRPPAGMLPRGRRGARRGAEPPVEERLRMLAIDPAESDLLADVLANPMAEPIYIDRSTAEPVVAHAMPLTGSRGTVALPIVANDRFYGSITVSATDRPERLRAPAVTDLLVGVAAQTATALDNAWLIEAMAHQARHDNLTGLLGHRAFHEALRDAIEGGENDQLTLALLDLDDFKLINDEHGHMVGDEALKSVAQALRATVREPDRLFRIAGEEFALLMPGLDRDYAVGVAERLRRAVAGARFRLPLRVSIGLASWPQDAEDRHRLFELADQALYAAKRDGKDRTHVAAAA